MGLQAYAQGFSGAVQPDGSVACRQAFPRRIGDHRFAVHFRGTERVGVTRAQMVQLLDGAGTESGLMRRLGKRGFQWKSRRERLRSPGLNCEAAKVVRNLVSEKAINPGLGASRVA